MNTIKLNLRIVSVEEIKAAGGTKEWAKKNNYHNTGKELMGKIKLTKKQWDATTKALIND